MLDESPSLAYYVYEGMKMTQTNQSRGKKKISWAGRIVEVNQLRGLAK